VFYPPGDLCCYLFPMKSKAVDELFFFIAGVSQFLAP
jgi:hypothetical protein